MQSSGMRHLKRGFDSQESEIGIEKVVQPILAFNGFHEDANRGRNAIFDRGEIYKKAFHDRSARHILIAFCVGKSIDSVRKSLLTKQNRRDTEEHQASLFAYLSFRNFLLACIGATFGQFIDENCVPSSLKLSNKIKIAKINTISSHFETVTRQVLRAVSNEIKTREESEKIQISEFLRDSDSLEKIKGKINYLIEMTLDGDVNNEVKKIIYIDQ